MRIKYRSNEIKNTITDKSRNKDEIKIKWKIKLQ